MGGMKMGKNLKAIICKKCKEEICYYGTTICSDCHFYWAREKFEEYQIAKVEGFIPTDECDVRGVEVKV